MDDEFYDPLTLDLHGQTRALLSKIPSDDSCAFSITKSNSTAQLLDNLSRALAVPAYTTCIATLFRPILFDLCARWVTNSADLEKELVAICLLIEIHEELFPLLYRILQNPVLAQGPIQPLHWDVSRTHRILLAYYRILQANRQLPSQLYWPITPLRQLVADDRFDNATRLLAIRCYALQSGMGEAEREKWERGTLGELYAAECSLGFGETLDGSQIVVDGWLMPIIELERVRTARQSFLTEVHSFYSSTQSISPSDLCPLVANIHGVLMLRSTTSEQISSILVPTPTAIKALRSLALHLTTRLPVLLTSPPSSGKTLLLSHLAETLFPDVKNQLVFIHLADTSLDPRSLLGSHVSSQTRPGNFEWKEGILVRAMREGKWVVFKDVDRGSNEVLALIKPLIESLGLGNWIGGRASLDIAGRGKVVAADSFAIFATRSVLPSRNGAFPAATFYGAHKLHEVVVHSPSGDELQSIVKSHYPRLTERVTKGLIRLWEAVRELGNTASTRDVGLRELEKFCLRTENLVSFHQVVGDSSESEDISLSLIFPNTSLREEIFLCARDVFFGSGTMTAAAKAHMESISRTVGNQLQLEPERQEWLLTRWAPDFEVERENKDGQSIAVRVGRTRLLAKAGTKREITMSVPRPFAMHRPATLLMSRIATSIALGESVLLTGETGTGKTSAITHLAHLLHQPLISLNLSNQTESSDLIGGFRPLDARVPALGLQSRFLDLFGETFNRKKNEKFEADVRKSVGQGKWKRAVGLWKESVKLAKEKMGVKKVKEDELDSETPRKRPKLDASAKWAAFEHDVEEFSAQYVSGKGRLAFGFVEGPIVQALREGNWILLDEINLASAETLECISGLLRSPTASITLTEQGSLQPVPRHPNFRLFACMNPATDVGKKDLPPNIRSRFTEIDVPPPDADRETLLTIVQQYIGPSAVSDKAAIMNVAEYYLAVKDLAETRQIADGSNRRPHFSMRTLARALTFASDVAGTYGLRRALWEGCLMAFTMVLDAPSAELITSLAQRHLLMGVKNVRSMLAKEPSPQDDCVKLGPFFLKRGPLPPNPVEDYVLTPSVERKLIDLARIILTKRFPVLIEGPTSSGKTSSVEYLAKRTGHRFIRINNHEHTDIQEYLGSYVPHPATGKLVFADGLLVRALRNGDWIVLDELNLAPTDVLEALNRLLDDNRELVIPETGEVVRPHPHFMLFATQNPPGLYAGRKVLSRAFRNRFLEVHFEDVPEVELETILCQRCIIAPSYGKKIVSVFRELQKRRQSGRVFESKQGFATLRDLFRWAGRDAIGYQELAENGYMLLAERARREIDKMVVKEVIESTMNVKIDDQALYNFETRKADLATFLGCDVPTDSSLIWTKAMQRLFILLTRALRFNEPVLLVGETGSGKTSVCQVFAAATSRNLYSLSCHQNTETADIIGGLRPLRDRGSLETDILRKAAALSSELGLEMDTRDVSALESHLDGALKSPALPIAARDALDELRRKIAKSKAIFEWHDGPLIEAMHNGDVFLLDEISLADDSVLERLNSVLEPSRTLVLAERAADDLHHPSLVAHESFKLVATMNPGGDYGKKELSPALRNRFTEIWVPSIDDRSDLYLIVHCGWKDEALRQYTSPVLDFIEWLSRETGDLSFLNLRDILAWVSFSNVMYGENLSQNMPTQEIFHHAAHMTYLDGLGSAPSLAAYSETSLQSLKLAAVNRLNELVPPLSSKSFVPPCDSSNSYWLGSFSILRGPHPTMHHSFNFQAPTSQMNAIRVVRACQLLKPILLEGSPGVGKTSLITALAKVSGHELCRINLSDQTDLIDLFGCDLPVDGGKAGEFAWKDGEFLRALQEGRWVLLDEMNLAPQAVLEGLNAVLDHRGSVYIPELGRTFVKHPAFRIFAAQNPLSQGGGRKGLPKSFVNRFTKVYVEPLSPSDLLLVCQHLYPDMESDILQAMITFNSSLHNAVSVERMFGKEGAPWEFNLRDVLRWIDVLKRPAQPILHPADHLRSIYLHRFRNLADRQLAKSIFESTFDCFHHSRNPTWTISASEVTIGLFRSRRENCSIPLRPMRLLKSQLSALEALGCSILHSSLAIITGARNTGKTSLVRTLANVAGKTVQEVYINSTTDATDLLGGFEQVDLHSRLREVASEVLNVLEQQLKCEIEFGIDTGAYLSLKKAVDDATLWNSGAVSEMITALADVPASPAPLSLLRNQVQEIMHTAKSDSAGRFEWIDGPLVRALKAGHWLLLDGANLCNASVLDRLNSLCETNGFLTLSEKGFINGEIQILKPHPDFRLFMTVDTQYGELSRAMRNRGVEIALIPSISEDDTNIIHDHHRLPIAVDHDPSPPFFTSVRLGIIGLQEHSLVSKIQAGCVLDQDSTLCHLLSIAPSLLYPSNSLRNDDPAVYHFLSRVLTPAAVPLFLRFLQCHQDNPSLQGSQLNCGKILSGAVDALSGLRKERGTMEMLTVSHLLGMPLDFFLGIQPSVLDLLPEHPTLLHILRLVVAVVLHEPRKIVSNTRAKTLQDSRMQQTTFAVTSLLREAHSAMVVTLQTVSGTEDVPCPDTRALKPICDIPYHLRSLSELESQHVLDYSALQPLANQIAVMSEDLPGAFASFRNCALRLKDATTLSSGLGMMQIWSMLYENSFSVNEIVRLEKLAVQIDGPFDLRRQLLNLMAIAPLSRSLEQKISANKLTETLQRRIQVDTEVCIDQNEPLEVPHLFVRLALLSLGSAGGALSNNSKRAIGHLNSIACARPFARLRHLLTYQQSLWLEDACQDILPCDNTSIITTSLFALWMHDLWGFQDGPAVLFQPAQLQSVLSIWNSRTPMEKLSEYETTLHSLTQLCLLSSEHVVSRLEQLTIVLKQSILKIGYCFSQAGNGSKNRLYSSALENDAQSRILALPELGDALGHSVFKKLVESHLQPAFAIPDAVETHSDYVARLGLCWISTGKLLLELFIPDAPIDPAAVQSHLFRFWSRHAASLSRELLLHTELEELLSGNSENSVTAYLKSSLAAAQVHFADGPPPVPPRDVSRIHMFWLEVLQFQKDILSPSKLDALVLLLKAGEDSADPREQVTQTSIKGFVQRLQTVYHDFDDIVFPIHYALLHLQTGLRILKLSSSAHHPADSTVTALTAFPAIRSAGALITQQHEDGLQVFQRLVLSMAAVSVEFAAGIDVHCHLPLLENTYEQALRLWHIDRKKEEEQQKSSESLYRQSRITHDMESDVEAEEREFAELFPSFESVLSNETSASDVSSVVSLTYQVSEPELKHFVSLHHVLFSGKDFPKAWYRSIRLSILPAFLDPSRVLPDTLDYNALPLCISLLADRTMELPECPGSLSSQSALYNFYTDVNIPETRKAAGLATKMKARLCALILEWPDQMVLQHLKERCDTFLALDLRSPVAKVLSALEQLLLHTEDWEAYANRENSLRDNRSSIIELIVSWRRLELSCWQTLLEAEARAFEDGVSSWWFRLYDAIIRGPLDFVQRDLDNTALSQYLDTLVSLLDDFIRGSPLGQFSARLQLLKSFDELCRKLGRVHVGQRLVVLERTRRIVRSTVGYFMIFSTTVAADLASERSTLEKEIRNLIKLASWKDVNVHALKQSAQRTHHQLYKLVRKFREVLRRPVSGHLQASPADDTEAREAAFVNRILDAPPPTTFPTILPHAPVIPKHLSNLDRTFNRFVHEITQRITPFISSRSPHVVEGFAVDIIVSSKELSSISISSSLSAERREKQHKALLTRKRKAWSDLLKELKKAGFAPHVKPEVLRQNESVRWNREQPTPFDPLDANWDFQKMELYWNRLNALFPLLRANVPSHHTDLSTRELQRGVAFLESSFSIAVESRTNLIDACTSYDALRRHLGRIRILASSSAIYSGHIVLHKVIATFDALSRMESTLSELQSAFQSLLQLDSESLTTSVTDTIRTVLVSCMDIRSRFKSLLDNVQLSSFPFLLTGEYKQTVEAVEFFQEAMQTLRLCADEEPRSRPFLTPALDWLQSYDLDISLTSVAIPTIPSSSDEIINTCLAGVHDLSKSCASPAIEEDRDHYIREDYRSVRNFTAVFKVDRIVKLLNNEFEAGYFDTDRYLPFLELYTDLLHIQLISHAHWTKSLLKLNFVLCSVLRTICQQGFCKPPEADEEGSGDAPGDVADGVGLGDGSGTNNVSKEIEEESQVEGLQGDEGESNEPRDDKDEDAIEMSQDFGGEMEDVPDNGSENEEGSDDESNPDPEEQIGDLDNSDPAAVDEKFWGDEKGPDDGDDKANKDNSTQKSGESEVVGKEGEKKTEAEQDTSAESMEETQQQPEREDGEENMPPEADDEDSSHPDANGAPMDEHVPEADTLELPDDMNMDTGEDVADEMDVDRLDVDENEEKVDDMVESEEPFAESADEQQRHDSPPPMEPDEAQEPEPKDGMDLPDLPHQADETQDEQGNAEEENGAIALPDVGEGDGDVTDDKAALESGQNSSGESGTAMGVAGEAEAATEKSKDQQGVDAPEPAEAPETGQASSMDLGPTTGAAPMGSERGQHASQQDEQLSNHPARSLADALKEVQRRFDEILDNMGQDVPNDQPGAAERPAAIEYLRPEDTDHDMQALGPAQEEQVAKLQELNLVDDGEPDGSNLPDIDMPSEPEGPSHPPRHSKQVESESKDPSLNDMEGAVVKHGHKNSFDGAVPNPDGPNADVEMEDVEAPDVELELRTWQAAGLPDDQATHIWRLYESLTHELAYTLCEQLRLILEPTLATRLKGDYRTGKRLNMKKIIPYIASDYTKDKIWLRRTRPSQREYQVLIALDDSQSMAESHSVHLAYQTLALVSKALTRLEAGDVGIAKFGRDVQILHGFDGAPFSDQAGMEVIKAFHFDQNATNVLSMVDMSLRVLEAARERRSVSSSTAADLWQLEIIISDGICQDHDKLRAVLRKAEEQRVMIVFIIIDSLHSGATTKPGSSAQGSILKMEKAEFKNIDGKMELQLQRYLDSFPFEYYVVLRDVEALPQVLSATLKQFFERIAEE